MWRKRRSAVFIDFENVKPKLTSKKLTALHSWLEDGAFEPEPVKRRIITTRIYWNSSSERHREIAEAAGMEVILCEKFAGLKNGADIRMALDIVEMCWTKPNIDEYIIFTTDSDFVPVLHRLRDKKKLSVIMADENRMPQHTTFLMNADAILPSRLLREAETYVRQEKRLIPSMSKKPASRIVKPAAGKSSAGSAAHSPIPPDEIEQAVTAVVRATSPSPKAYTSKKAILEQLKQIKTFSMTGKNAYFGLKSYRELMQTVEAHNANITVDILGNGSIHVMYVPQDAAED